MALIVNNIARTVPGSEFSVTANVTLGNSYPNPGGFVVTAQTFNLNVLKRLIFNAFTSAAGAAYSVGLVPTYNADGVTLASVAIHVVLSSTGLEVANGVDVSGLYIQLIAEGK